MSDALPRNGGRADQKRNKTMRRARLIVPALLVCVLAAAVGYHRWTHDPMADVRSMLQRGDLRGAQLTLRQIVRNHPDRAEAHLRLGKVQLQLGDPIAAEHELREAAERGADEHAVRPFLAEALVGEGHGDVVLRDDDDRGLDPGQSATLHMARAMAALAGKQPLLARKEADAARRAAPGSKDAALNGARVARAVGDLEGARRAVDDALVTDPAFSAALQLRAELLAQAGDRAGAIKAYDAAIAAVGRANAASVPSRLARANLLIGINSDGDARRDVDATLAIAPRDPVANMLSSVLDARAGRWNAADEALTQVGTAIDRFPRADLLIATVKARIGQPQQALAAAEHFGLRHPDDRAGAVLLGSLELGDHRPTDAIHLLEPWDVPGRIDPDVLALLSQAYAMAGDRARADATLRRAGDAGGKQDTQGLDRLAAIALGENDPDLAADDLSKALDRSPEPELVDVPGRTGSGEAPPSQSQTAAALVVTSLRAGEIDRAAAALGRLRQTNAAPEQIDLLTGAVKLAQFNVRDARAAFQSAHARDPGSVEATVNLARVLRLEGDLDGAAGLLKDALARQPADPTLLGAFVDLSTARGGADAMKAALDAAEAAHGASPGDAGITGGLATLDLRMGRAAEALALVKLLPGETIQKLGLRADAQRELGRIDDAVATWRALLARSPSNIALRHRIVGLLITAKRFDDARSLVDDGLAATPDDPTLQADAVRMASARDGLAAGVARAEELAARSADPRALLLKGELLLAAGKADDAARAFAEARAKLGKDAAADVGRALIRLEAIARVEAGDRAAGVALLEAGLSADPNAASLQETLAEMEIGSGDLAAAKPRLVSVLKSDPDNAVALNDLAWIEQQQDDLAGAHRDAARAYRIGPTPQIADTLGWVLLAQGHTDDALALLRQAASQTVDPAIRYHLASALQEDGKSAQARALLGPVLNGRVSFTERPAAEKLMRTLASP